jgi:hypothetical protein
MRSNSFFQQVKTVTIKGLKEIRVFGISSMVVWTILFSFWLNAVYVQGWNLLNTTWLLAKIACIYLLMTAIGVIVISFVSVYARTKISNFIYSFLGFVIGVLLTNLASIIVWAVFYSNHKGWNVNEMIYNPMLFIQSILTIVMLIYVGWKTNSLLA